MNTQRIISSIITDCIIAQPAGNGGIDLYTADLVSVSDYYPNVHTERSRSGFGMDERGFSSPDYRYGFSRKLSGGKEKDPEGMGGGGTTYDYGFRIYNPGIAKFLSVDPLTAAYPWYTPYQFAGNKPVIAIDLDGLEEKIVSQEFYNKGLGKIYEKVRTDKDLKAVLATVNRKDKQAEVTVYYGVIIKSQRGSGGLGGFTVDLKEIAKSLVLYDFSSDFKMSLTDDEKKQYNEYKELFKINGIDYNEIAKSNKKVFGVFLDPEESNEDAAFALLHEVKAHLENRVKGIIRTTFQEHSDFYNYKDNPKLLKKYPELKKEKSPPMNEIPTNSKVGELWKKVKNLYKKDTVSNTDKDENIQN